MARPTILSEQREYRAWVYVKESCSNPRHGGYAHNGARGIRVCPEWENSFDAFYRDMGTSPGEGYALLRHDHDGDFDRWNCYWGEKSELITRVKTTHGYSKTPEYKSWSGMKDRCLNRNHHAYKDYGGRGIRVCADWRDSFEAFLAHVGRKPGEEYSIDRINNWGDYEPGNVRWATMETQTNNRRNSRHLEFEKQEFTVTEFAAHLGVSERVVRKALRDGYDEREIAEDILFGLRQIYVPRPDDYVHQERFVHHEGERFTLRALAARFGVDYTKVYRLAVRRNLSDERVVDILLHGEEKPGPKVKLGDVFGRLTVVGRNPREGRKDLKWDCRCACGSERAVKVIQNNLLRGHTVSCGCHRKEVTARVHGAEGRKLRGAAY